VISVPKILIYIKNVKKISLCSHEHKAYLVYSANLLPLGQHAVNPLKKWLFMYRHPPIFCIYRLQAR